MADPADLSGFGLTPSTGAAPAAAAPAADPIGSAGLVPSESPEAAQIRAKLAGQTVVKAYAPWLPDDPAWRFVRGAADEASFGLSNWAIGATHAAPTIASWFTGLVTGKPSGADPATDISLSRDQARSDVEQFKYDNPALAGAAKATGFVGQLAAGGLLDAGLGKLGGALVRTAADTAPAAAPSVGSIAARSAGTGGVLGAAAGAGNAPPGSTPGDVVRSALVGAGVGAGVGGIAGPINQGAFDTAKAILGGGTTMRQESENLGNYLAGLQTKAGSVSDAGKTVSDAIDAKATAAQAAAEAAYKDAAAQGAALHPGVAAQTPALVQSWLRTRANIPVELGTPESRAAFPKANMAFDAIGKMADGAANGPVPLDGPPGTASVAETRRLINSPAMAADATNRGDAAALSAVRKGYNDVFAATGKIPGAIVDAQTGQPATGDAVAKTLEGNAQWSRFKALTAPAKDDTPGKVIAAWKDDGATGDAVAADLYGATKFTNPRTISNAIQVVGRVKDEFGSASTEFNAVQQGLFLKAVGDNPQAPLTPKQTRTNLIALTSGPGKPLAEAVFTPNQIIAIKRFANSIPDSGPGVKGTITAKAFQLAGAAVGAAFGFHFGGDLLGAVGSQVPTAMMGLTGGAETGVGLAVGSGIGHVLTSFMQKDAMNPLLYRPVFASRVARVTGEVGGADVGGLAASGVQATPKPASAPLIR